jgi:hypothetical protein
LDDIIISPDKSTKKSTIQGKLQELK